MAHPQGPSTSSKWLITLALVALVALSWSAYVDNAATAATTDKFKRALTVAAVARGFNGVISVAQGTEVAVQPVGIGVTLTLGEILDPLNDLVERFSFLALIASVALGAQLTLGEMAATLVMSGLMTAAVVAYLVVLWITPQHARSRRLGFALRTVSTLIFARFLIAAVLLTSSAIDDAFLRERQDAAMQNLQTASEAVADIQQEAEADASADAELDFFDRTARELGALIDSSTQALDVKAQLAALEAEVEASVEEMIKLIVIFLLQTVVLPMGTLWLAWLALKAFWRWTGSHDKP